MTSLKTKIILVALFTCNIINAQIVYQRSDSLLFEEYITEFKNYRDDSSNLLFLKTAKHFLGKPYIAGTLENAAKEELIINLREFDCTTLVENSVALTDVVKTGDATFNNFCDALRKIRYRDGVINGYASRLHYSSDWIVENANKFENITLKLGGTIVDKPLNFMSTKYQLYPALRLNEGNRKKIKEIEKDITMRRAYTVLSVDKLNKIESELQDGDIVLFATKIQGLDYSHMGIILKEGQEARLLHASSINKQVIIDSRNLIDYCSNSKSCSGVTILRLKRLGIKHEF